MGEYRDTSGKERTKKGSKRTTKGTTPGDFRENRHTLTLGETKKEKNSNLYTGPRSNKMESETGPLTKEKKKKECAK